MKILAALLSLTATAAFSMTIVGVGSTGTYYEVNPLTGAVTQTGSGPWSMPTSASATPGAYFANSGVNAYLVNYPGGSAVNHCTVTCSSLWDTGDTAYDFGTGTLFAVAQAVTGPSSQPLWLASLSIGPLQPGGYRALSANPIMPLPATGFPVIEAIPGVGILLTWGSNAALLNPYTATTIRTGTLHLAGGTPVPATVTSLAYDPGTGRLIGTSGVFNFGQPTTLRSVIYSVDAATFELTVLNPNAPNLSGIATINDAPEPGTMLLVAVALFAISRVRSGKRRLDP